MEFKKILVTGAAGFIGHALCKKLIQENHIVVGLDNINDYYTVDLKYDRLADMGIVREEAEQWNKLTSSTTDKNLQFIRMKIEDRENLPQLFENQQFDAVIHLAAQAGVRYSLENPMAYVDSNLVGFVNIMEACRHHKIKHLVYASSSSVYGANKKVPFEEADRVDYPVSLYAATKKSNELMAYTYSHLYQLKTSGLRFFTVYGPWGRPDMAPMLFANAITQNKPIKVFNHGNMKRDFTYIDDIVNGIIITLNNPPETEHLGAGDFENERSGDGEEERTGEMEMGRSGEQEIGRLGEKEIAPHPHTPPPSHPHPHTPNYQLFNIGNGSPVGLMGFIETMEKELGIEAKKNLMDMQPGDVPRTWAETSQLNALGYQSTTNIQEGVRKFVEWFENY